MERTLDTDLAALDAQRRPEQWARFCGALLKPLRAGNSARQLFFSILGHHVSAGELTVIEPAGRRQTFGGRSTGPTAVLEIKDPSFYGRILQGGSLALGETYVEGLWSVPKGTVCDFLGVLLSNMLYLKVAEHPLYRIRNAAQKLRFHSRSAEKARECISYHYDLSNDFFALMLDPTMTYSCGYQLTQSDSLEDMQRQKYDLVCSKLQMSRGGTLLDIGCGWGGMLLHSAAKYPEIAGLGITLSREQLSLAKERAEKTGVDDRIKFALQDYRHTSGTYDFIVSIGMFEHVARNDYPLFMRTLRKHLAPHGRGLLHCIGLTDDPDYPPDPWMSRYIFPGHRLPRLEELVGAMQKAGLTVAHVENLKLHYAETLKKWRENVKKNHSAMASLGTRFNEQFFRGWDYYLQCCEAGFRYSSLQVYQIVFTPSGRWNLPLVIKGLCD